MATVQTSFATEVAIWSRLLQAGGKTLTLQAARSLLRLDFAPEDKQRMHELAARAREGLLSTGEQTELTNYERVGNLLALIKSKARQRLKKVAANGAER